jgi:hypothetical protein
VDVEDLDRRLGAAVAAFDPRIRRELARILELPDAERALEIGRMHRITAGSELSELLIDLEADERVRRLVLAEVHSQLRE